MQARGHREIIPKWLFARRGCRNITGPVRIHFIQFQLMSILPNRGPYSEIQSGREYNSKGKGVKKSTTFKGKYENKLELLVWRALRVRTKKYLWEGYEYSVKQQSINKITLAFSRAQL